MVYRIITPIGIGISVLLTILAIIGIAEKDRPEFYGLGGKQETVKLSEYAQIIKANKPMQRLMVAGAGCKLALAIATNTTVLLALYGIVMGNYNSLYLPMMVLGYVCAVPFFLLSMRTSQKKGPAGLPHPLRLRGPHLLRGRAGAAAGQRLRQPQPDALLPL